MPSLKYKPLWLLAVVLLVGVAGVVWLSASDRLEGTGLSPRYHDDDHEPGGEAGYGYRYDHGHDHEYDHDDHAYGDSSEHGYGYDHRYDDDHVHGHDDDDVYEYGAGRAPVPRQPQTVTPPHEPAATHAR